ncbi:hypothetical protein [Kangiella sediminilitoris]|uniref:Uncharacterized protein n=1 Tax=Kangiella sediminilitoris TaxID=1144748 RepID=A0A1B3B7L8_9GAMM|nr:hypothetical protein [Kangiella sediminilitoris]AOE48783.1 hypothetical protein KS2013_51 [Kangiella sediminilitoris]
MAEASGYVVIKAPEQLMKTVLNDFDDVSYDSMVALFKHAGIDATKGSDSSSWSLNEWDRFTAEDMELVDGYLRIITFGDDWMPAIKTLIKEGKDIEVYGKISHEYGFDEYYILNKDGESYFENVDFEGDHNVEREEEIGEIWLQMAPLEIREDLSESIDIEEDIEEDEDNEEDDVWSPTEESDFVQEYEGFVHINEALLNPEIYETKYLKRALELGAQLVNPEPHGWKKLPTSKLTDVISSLEIDADTKTKIAIDMLENYDFNLNTVYKVRSGKSGTALSVAAGNGLVDVVNKLIEKGVEPDFAGEHCPIEAAQKTLKVLPLVIDYEPLDEQGSEEDLKEVINILEKLQKEQA